MSLWGGRFQEGMSPVTREFTGDIADRRLLRHDVEGSLAHVAMLGATGILAADEVETLTKGLEQVGREAADFEFLPEDEDVHSAVERRLGEIAGEVAGKLHTGRSRNDQVTLDLRLYLRDSGRERMGQIADLVGILAEMAEQHAATVIPSYTHLQQAQATTLGHHLLAHAWALVRSRTRLSDAVGRLSISPLGAGASAGSSLPLDTESTARHLGLSGVMANSMDAVAARDFIAEYVFCCAQGMVELSRLAEEIVLWSSTEFGWATLSDEVSTGSSALPHKRNPDIAELVRGRAATVIGDVSAALALQKGLPLTYNRDLQEDKRIVFHADDTLAAALAATGVLLRGIRFSPPPPGAETAALDLAEALVRRGVPFREAHGVVGRLLVLLESAGRTLADATADDLAAADTRFAATDLHLLDPEMSVRSRATPGSGNPESVRTQVAALREIL